MSQLKEWTHQNPDLIEVGKDNVVVLKNDILPLDKRQTLPSYCYWRKAILMVEGRIEDWGVWHTAAGQGVGEKPSGKILRFGGGETIVRDFCPFGVLGDS